MSQVTGHRHSGMSGFKFPSWYVSNPTLSEEDAALAKRSWSLVVENKAAGYLKIKGSREDFPSCVSFFYESFYTRLFEVEPASRALFKGNMDTQGKALTKMIGVALSLVKTDVNTLVGALQGLARGHASKGVKSTQYGTVGEVLLYTLEKVLGSDAFDSATKHSWVVIYSLMMSVIIPVALLEEKKYTEVEKVKTPNNAFFTPAVFSAVVLAGLFLASYFSSSAASR